MYMMGIRSFVCEISKQMADFKILYLNDDFTDTYMSHK